MSETIYEHLGGIDALRRLTRIFYGKVRVDPELEALFGAMPDDHPERVALWLAEVFGGPQQYTGERGGYATMVLAHINLGITESQRARWAELLYASLDEAGLPADERFRRTFHDYIEWGPASPCATRRSASGRRARRTCPPGRGRPIRTEHGAGRPRWPGAYARARAAPGRVRSIDGARRTRGCLRPSRSAVQCRARTRRAR